MSSTNRKNSSARHIADYYFTPLWAIKEFLAAFNSDYPEFAAMPKQIIDPCSGGDEENEMAYPAAIQRFSNWSNYRITTIDIRPNSRADCKEDFIFWNPPTNQYDMAITNPPFNIAMDVINKCGKICAGGGLVVMLLRLNFFGSQQRREFFNDNMPERVYVHSKRMSFHGAKGTDSIEYMHAVWRVGRKSNETILKII